MIWFIIATLVAFFIKGLCGFANTLIFNGILSYTANNINISPLEVVLGYPSNIILVWKERKSLNWKIWLPLTALVVAGSIPGIFLLKHTDAVATITNDIRSRLTIFCGIFHSHTKSCKLQHLRIIVPISKSNGFLWRNVKQLQHIS